MLCDHILNDRVLPFLEQQDVPLPWIRADHLQHSSYESGHFARCPSHKYRSTVKTLISELADNRLLNFIRV